jgi:two-component system CheB/CheR fusion protein
VDVISLDSLETAALAAARDMADIGVVVRTAARRLTASDGATFVLRDGDSCFYADEDAISPLWKGQRFPLAECISGWTMLNAATAAVPDIEKDPRVPLAVYRPTFVKSLVVVPVGDPVVAAIGSYWGTEHGFRPGAVTALEEMAGQVGEAVDRVGLDTAPWAPNFRHPR